MMDAPKDSGDGGVALLLSKARCFEIMEDALQKPFHLDCGPSVERIRQGFYRARRFCQARSVYRFDRLSFHVRGPTLVIKKRSVPTASQLVRRIEALQELCECAAPHNIDADALCGSGWQKA